MATPAQIDQSTILSLLLTLLLLLLTIHLSRTLLPPRTPPKTHLLYTWHLFSALTHLLLEASFLLTLLFSRTPGLPNPSNFLNDPAHAYGAALAAHPAAKLWQVYARADARWAGADPVVVSVEIVTVVLAGPLAWAVAEGVRRSGGRRGAWVVGMLVNAVLELYGGWMTFAPEWVSGCGNLDGGNVLFL
ncbi:MAG: hypothetical protein M1829_001945 [Trizodia sp. TS-e1964]|nr:MAG: hypothetical protein M1829_001945 [Trizodia sp. TS-e1964]